MNKSNSRAWHPNFTKYVKHMVKHDNYKNLLIEFKKDNTPKWVVAGKSKNGLKRRQWWDNECKKHNITIEAGCYAKVAEITHPTKKHVCQICGRELDVRYIYPNARLIKKLEILLDISIKPYFIDIFQIIDKYISDINRINQIKDIFQINDTNCITKESLKTHIIKHHIQTRNKALLSPGVMSNSPDRFDGYHSDGNCCRKNSDKGRSKENLLRYTQDRRVYENWTDGNWKMADRLMAEFRKYNISPDHIGPISLGFCHRPKFAPMSKSANSAKNNRMTFSDVQLLINDERNGDTVISWHSKYIWDTLKNEVKNDIDAKKLSSMMRENLHNVLVTFAYIHQLGYDDFLKSFLNPEYSFYDYKFIGFNPQTGEYKKFSKSKKTGKNQKNNVERYTRIAFETLHYYNNKKNRKISKSNNLLISNLKKEISTLLLYNNTIKAKEKLIDIFRILAEDSKNKW